MALRKEAQDFFDNVLKNYRIVLVYNPEELKPKRSGCPWSVYVQEWEGCMSDGRTPEEALEMIADAAEGWRDACLEDGLDVPPPKIDIEADSGTGVLQHFSIWQDEHADWSGKKHG